MKSLNSILVSSVVIGSLVSACGPVAPKLVAPAQVLKAVSIQAGSLSFDAQSKVDILLVVDNSMSMEPHQASLSREIDKFVDQFSKNGLIDFHIGVVPVYDARAVSLGRKIHPKGHLVPLKKTSAGLLFGTPETPNLNESLKETIKIGFGPGPEWEESFSPVLAVMNPEVNQINQGFYRPEAHLAVIFITDADDAGSMTPEQFYKELVNQKGQDKSKILISGALPLEKTCLHDDDLVKRNKKGEIIAVWDPVFMIRLLDYVPDTVKVSLCSKDLGTKLADFGNKLSERVGRKVIFLPERPEEGTLKLRYGTQVIEESYEKGWAYFPNQQKIELSGKLSLKHEDNAQVTVEYTAIHDTNLKGGNVRVIGN
ncbi:MAG: hypothetical protein K2X47_07020 [Bdellovibrionales bacterium]|nr:hypothetical protein [Bdellovibrionales bacterium]